MRINIDSWEWLNWKGGNSVRFRVQANTSFLARDDDGTHVMVDASPAVFLEVDCTVSTQTIEGVPMQVLTVPAIWLFSTNDAIVNRLARYRASFVTKSGATILNPELIQDFHVLKELEDVFLPVPWQEIIRANFPSAPIPINKNTYSTDQILELIGDGPVQIGSGGAAGRFAVWQGPTSIGAAFAPNTGANFQDGDPTVDFFRFGGDDTIVRIRQDGAVGNPKVLTFGANLVLHTQDASTQWHLLYANDTATNKWANNIFDDGRLEFRSYSNADAPLARVTFDKDGGIGVRRVPISSDTAWLFRDSDGFHLGTSNTNDIAAANRQLTFVPGNTGIGINKQTVIEAQLDILSGNASRVAFLARAAQSTTADIARFTTFDGSRRVVIRNDGGIELGQSNAIKGSVLFHRPNTANDIVIQPPNTGDAVTYTLPITAPANGQLLRTQTFSGGVATLEWVNPTAGGDVSSDIGSVVDNTLTRFQSTSGKLITSSAVIVADTTGAFTVPNDWAVTNAAALSVTLAAATLTLQGLAGSSIAIQQTKTLFNAPAQSAAVAGFDHVQGSQTQSTGLSRLAVFAATYNQTSTAASTSLEITRTETALGSGEHNFIKGFGGAAGTTARFRINHLGNYFFGATGGFIGDQNGNEYLIFNTVASAVNEATLSNAATGGNVKLEATGGDTNIILELAGKGTTLTAAHVRVKNALFVNGVDNSGLAVIYMNDSSAAKQVSLGFQNNTWNFNRESGGFANMMSFDLPTTVATFAAIPVGPNSTPTTDNQLARKKYVDDRIVTFNLPFRIDDPSTFPLNDDGGMILVRVPPITGGFISKITILRPSSGGGSHTGGTSVTFKARIFNNSSIGSGVSFDDTNNASNTVYTEDFSDTAISEGNYLLVHITARTGTVAERLVSINIEGYRKHQN